MNVIGVIAQATGDHAELVWAGVITSSVALVGIIITAILARSNGNNIKTSGATAAAILGELSTGNGHSLGTAVARIEETLWRHETRLDAIEVEMREIAVKQAEAHLLSYREATE